MAGRHVRIAHAFAGRVGEWLKPADCKSAAPCGLRRFESSPVHHPSSYVDRSLHERGIKFASGELSREEVEYEPAGPG